MSRMLSSIQEVQLAPESLASLDPRKVEDQCKLADELSKCHMELQRRDMCHLMRNPEAYGVVSEQKLFPLTHRARKKNILKNMENTLAERAQRFSEDAMKERQDRVNACLLYCSTQKLSPDEINDDDFEEFFTTYQVEQAERARQELELALAPKRKGKYKKKTPAIVVHTASDSVPEPVPVPAQTVTAATQRSPEQVRFARCRAWFSKRRKLHSRVLRWRKTDNVEIMQNYTDGPDKKKPYGDKSPDEIRKLKRYHELIGIERLAFNDAYAFSTPTGRGMLCRVETDGAKDRPGTIAYGTTYFGIDPAKNNLIYHLFFQEQRLAVQPADILKGPEIDGHLKNEVNEKSSEEKEEEVGLYNTTLLADGTIKIAYPTKNYSVFIYPCRKDLLPKEIFAS
jgi:hypothetical protein